MKKIEKTHLKETISNTVYDLLFAHFKTLSHAHKGNTKEENNGYVVLNKYPYTDQRGIRLEHRPNYYKDTKP